MVVDPSQHPCFLLPNPSNEGYQPLIYTVPTFELESGTIVHQVPVAYMTWGRLNAAKDNVIVVCHALTGSADVTEWWPGMVGPGLVLDTSRFFIVCCNVPGSPYGTFSPLSLDVTTNLPWGVGFPSMTIRDDVCLHKQVLDHLGVSSVALCIGGSYGGMQVLEWALLFNSFVKCLVVLATSGRQSPWCIGWSDVQRQAIFNDPNFNQGRYTSANPPSHGLAIARMCACLTYRFHTVLEDRFGREQAKNLDTRWYGVRSVNTDDDDDKALDLPAAAPCTRQPFFSVQSYLHYQGQKFINRFDANCYIALTYKLDTHDIARDRGEFEQVLASIQQPALVFGVDSDVLYTLPEQQVLAKHMAQASLVVVESSLGHDGFLLEVSQIVNPLRQFIERHLL